MTQSYRYIHSVSHVTFHHVLSQEIGYNSLCHTVGTILPFYLFIYLLSFFFFSGPHLWHLEVPRLGVNRSCSCQLADVTATATTDPSRVCNLHHSSQQCQILNPGSEARDQTRVLMDSSQIRCHSYTSILKKIFKKMTKTMGCGVGCRHGSDLAFLWLWRRLAATAPI